MDEKLNQLFNQCIVELNSIGINFDEEVGKIDISIAKRNNKRYGCCKQEMPDIKTSYKVNGKVYYKKFNMHHIEISKWVMDLNDDKIKNTIIHELIHCLPNCNNHGKWFKQYAKIINNVLGYNIGRVGNKKQDFEESNLEFKEDIVYKYKIKCSNCNQLYYRKKLAKNFFQKYRCGKCKGKLILQEYLK